jgi:hypothetical protein
LNLTRVHHFRHIESDPSAIWSVPRKGTRVSGLFGLFR